MLRAKRSDGSCRCRLLKLTRRGTTTGLSGDFGILPLGGHVGVVGGQEAGRVKEAGCVVFLPLTTLLVVIDGVRMMTHAAREFTGRIVRRIGAPRPRVTGVPRLRDRRVRRAITLPTGGRVTGSAPVTRDGDVPSSIMFRIMRMVPRFPKKRRTLVRCLTGGVGCPMATRRGKGRKHIVIDFIIGGSKGVSSVGMTQDMSPCLSGRTMEMVTTVPR